LAFGAMRVFPMGQLLAEAPLADHHPERAGG
jgi:hypothetical protein